MFALPLKLNLMSDEDKWRYKCYTTEEIGSLKQDNICTWAQLYVYCFITNLARQCCVCVKLEFLAWKARTVMSIGSILSATVIDDIMHLKRHSRHRLSSSMLYVWLLFQEIIRIPNHWHVRQEGSANDMQKSSVELSLLNHSMINVHAMFHNAYLHRTHWVILL